MGLAPRILRTNHFENATRLAPAQHRVADLFPATVEEVVATLNFTESTVRDHIAGIQNAGYDVVSDDGVRYMPDDMASRKEHPTNVNKRSKASKTQQTRAANQHLAELNDWLVEILNRSEPAVADGGLVFNESNEDVVIHRSDDHIGEEKYDEFGNKVYDEKIAADRIRSVTDSVMDLVDREGAANRTYDTAHLLLGGDQVPTD